MNVAASLNGFKYSFLVQGAVINTIPEILSYICYIIIYDFSGSLACRVMHLNSIIRRPYIAGLYLLISP